MTFDPRLLQKSHTYFGSDQVYVSDGKSLNIEEIGSTTLRTSSTKMKPRDVLVVPPLTQNLLFVPQLTHDNNCSIVFPLGLLHQGAGRGKAHSPRSS